MYRVSYFITISGLLLMSFWHPVPRMQLALFILMIANAIFLWM